MCPSVIKEDPTVPRGYCNCGCGQKTKIAPRTFSRWGIRKGEPFRFIRGHGGRKLPSQLYRVEDHGFETPCWIWHSVDPGVYGRCGPGRGEAAAHRFMYQRHRGPIPDGLQLDHLCRVPGCVNPDHLEPVTQTENVRRGAGTRLTWEDAEEIRRLVDEGMAQTAVGERFGIHQGHVSHIVHKRYWAEP